jgi:choline dehydrogenase
LPWQNHLSLLPDVVEMFDYVIVGAGSAGCVLADRLSESGQFSVLLLEAGGSDWNPFVHMPAGIAQLSKFPGMSWNYDTQAEPNLDGRSLYWPRGKLLGGSSSINAMCYIRGHKSDYDHWAALGNAGWAYSDVLAYFRKSECNSRGADAFHGDSGPLHVSDLRHTNLLSHAFIDAAQQAGFAANSDFNGAQQAGFGLFQVTQNNGRRCSTAASFLARARTRRNFTLRTHAQALGLEFTGSRATGVRYLHHGSSQTVHAAREVLLSGGAINSPQLLLLSGIGDVTALRQLGIKPRIDLPGVGKNLQDHLDICTLNYCNQKITYDSASDVMVGLEYLCTGGGIGSSNIAESGGFAASRYAQADVPDLQFHFVPALLEDHGRTRPAGQGFTLHVCALRPESRGEITLASSDPLAKARMQPNYLSAGQDLNIMLDGMRISRDIFAAKSLAAFTDKEFLPGREVQTEAELTAFIRRKAETIYHPVGTCKMGHDPLAVVDDQLRVHGALGLRVVDASIMPTLIGGNTNAPTIMIAERAADLILAAA